MTDASTKPLVTRGQRSTRRLLTILAAVLLLAALCLWIVTRSWFLVSRLQPVLERRLGGDVEIESVTYQGAGRLAITGLTLSSRKHSGTPAEIVRIGRALIVVDVFDLLRGTVTVKGVDLDDVRLRLSEDVRETGAFTFMALDPDWLDDDGGERAIIDLPPYIIINGALIEVGVHEDDRFQVTGRRWLKGAMAPLLSREGWMGFSMMETSASGRAGGEQGLVMQGTWNVTTNEYRSQIQSVELDANAYGLCPSIARLWWDQMQLDGRVANATISWDPDTALGIAFDVENVAMTLPIGAQEFWARYRDGHATLSDDWPRMHVTSGTIRINRDSIFLENLVGELRSSAEGDLVVPVPYEISLAIPQLPPLRWKQRDSWLKSVLAEVPFEMSVRLTDLSLVHDDTAPAPAVDLPLVMARFLERFRIRDWALSAEFDLARREGQSAIESSGEAYIHRATGAFHSFPYRLDEIEAYVQFDRDRVTIHQLVAVGAEGAPIAVTGEIAPPGPDAGVHLRLRAEDVPLDERLRAALKPAQAKVFDVLLHEPSAASLATAGLLADETTIAAAQRELETVKARLADGLEGDAAAAGLRRRLLQLEHIIAAGPFEVGGAIDLDLTIDREPGPGRRAVTQGRIDIVSAGLLFDKFPYPVWFTGGVLDWRPDRITILGPDGRAGAPLLTPGGGRGVLSGTIDLAREENRVQPRMNLQIVVDDDATSPALLAAIPPTNADRRDEAFAAAWPGGVLSQGARTIRGIGLEGPLSYDGTLVSEESGRIAFEFDVELAGGSAHPSGELSAAIGAEGLHWPEAWHFDDVSGRVRIVNEAIELVSLAGRHESGNVEATGVIDLSGRAEGTRLDVAFRNVEVDAYLVDLVPAERSDRARELWQRYQPQGRVDATLAYRAPPDGAAPALEVEVVPQSVALEVDGQALLVRWNDGHIALGADGLELDGVDLAIESGSRSDGRLRLDGFVREDDEGDPAWRIEGTWSGGQFRCPLISHLMSRLSSPDQLQRFRTLDPRGVFDGEFVYGSADDDSRGADHFTFNPASLSLEVGEGPIYLEFDPGSRFTFSDRLITLDTIAGTLGSGGRFDLAGEIQLTDGVDARLDLGFAGQVRTRQFEAIAPDTVNEALDAIKFQDGGTTRIENSRLRFKLAADTTLEADAPVEPVIEFEGTVRTEGASFDPGLPITGVHGAFEIVARHGPGHDPVLELTTTGARASVYGNELVDAEAALRLDALREAIIVEDVRGRLHDGVLSAGAVAGVGENRRWSCSVDLAGVSLAAILAARSGEEVADSAPRGQCFAGLDVAGLHGDDASRRGRGMVRIIGGLADVPLVLRLTQVMQFTLPFGDRLEYGEVDFYLAGDQLNFERILLESGVGNMALLQLLGTGSMELGTFELDTRFRSRGGVAVVRDVVGGLGDQLYQIQVTGTLDDPVAKLLPLPGLNAPKSGSRSGAASVASVP